MQKRVVILGGAVGGLASAIAFARRGWRVTVIERDPGPQTDDGDESFLSWERPSVAQFRQPHGFSARSRNLLLEHIPEVVERLRAAGVEEVNFFKLFAPPDMWEPEDELFTNLWVRRPPFELELRAVAAAEPGVELRSPAVATGLVWGEDVDGVPAVRGVRVGDAVIDADVVFDCGGRRTPVPRWLLEDKGIEVPVQQQDCESVYYTRYFRRNPSSELPAILLAGGGSPPGDKYSVATFTGDHDTYSLSFFTMSDDAELRVLRHTWAWEAAARAVPTFAPWVDPANGTPLHDVQVMTNFQNLRRRYVIDGRPLVANLFAVGDSLCATNPQYGWGASMALTYAFAAVDAATSTDNPLEGALRYEDAIAADADAVYEESAAADRFRIYQFREQEVPEWDLEAMERQSLIIEGVGAGALRDAILGRAFLKRLNLIGRVDATLDDEIVRQRAIGRRERNRERGAASPAPPRAELLAAIRAAAPAPDPDVRAVAPI